ncbi:PREDICTED: G-type lectin S-receptor [Prunus dulcis]|uniref:PREDICTED: G-type lectin S-receptor n=1 Tax=Prunus dulcis TaxID=3755 RepID=A0A5E4G079_PRUDU|nr:PREDICTED: G-type lectin S-receptor [Prunus dulcis]
MASLGSLSLEQASKYGMLIFLVICNHDGSVYLESEDGVILRTILSNTFSMQDFYQRATLEYHGVLRYYYVYPKRSSSNMRSPRAWSTSSYMPSNICASISEETGGGVCRRYLRIGAGRNALVISFAPLPFSKPMSVGRREFRFRKG